MAENTAARIALLEEILPTLAFLELMNSRERRRGFSQLDARRAFLERATGETPLGSPSPRFHSLEQGQAPSLARLEEAQSRLESVILPLLEDPNAYGLEPEESE